MPFAVGREEKERKFVMTVDELNRCIAELIVPPRKKAAKAKTAQTPVDVRESKELIHAFTVKPMMGWLILQGIKDVENRSKGVKPPKGTCAVTFSKVYTMAEYESDLDYLENDIGLSARQMKKLPKYDELTPFCGKVAEVVRYEVANDSPSQWYHDGRIVWKMTNPRWIPQPFPIRGFVNMWNLTPADAKKIKAQL